jgi:hypothetical protein
MKIINFLIVVVCIVIIVAFFLPWIAGSGSLAKPFDDGTSVIQKTEPTGLFRAIIKTAKGTVDTATAIISPIDLDRELKGYEIPIADETVNLRPRIYLIYILPFMALVSFFGTLKKKQSMFSRFLRFAIITAITSFLFLRVESLNREGLFLKIEALAGFFLTLYSYIALSILTFLSIFPRQITRHYSRKKKV